MAKYRKKPVVIEAVKWDGTDGEANAISRLSGPNRTEFRYDAEGNPIIVIETLEGTMKARLGDYVIQGVNGEVYPCKPDIFEQTYEPAE